MAFEVHHSSKSDLIKSTLILPFWNRLEFIVVRLAGYSEVWIQLRIGPPAEPLATCGALANENPCQEAWHVTVAAGIEFRYWLLNSLGCYWERSCGRLSQDVSVLYEAIALVICCMVAFILCKCAWQTHQHRIIMSYRFRKSLGFKLSFYSKFLGDQVKLQPIKRSHQQLQI